MQPAAPPASVLPPGPDACTMGHMTAVLHVIDQSTPRDLLVQLGMLSGPDDTIVSVGPQPHGWGSALSAVQVRRGLGPAAGAGKPLGRLAPRAGLVHAWSSAPARPGRVAADILGVPLVVSLSTAAGAKGLGAMLDEILAAPEKAIITVPTEASRGVLARGRRGEGEVVQVLAPASEPIDDAPKLRKQTRDRLGLKDDQPLLAAPGEMTRQAGHKYASWMHAILRHILPDVCLLLPGGGPAEQFVRNFAATTGFDEEVFLTGGRFSPGDVLAAADVVLFLNERDTGVGDLAAAMSAGVPIVASETPDFAEIISDGTSGLLVAPRDPRVQSAAVIRLIEEGDLARRLGRAAAKHAKTHFQPALCRQRLGQIYAGLNHAFSC